MSATYLPAAVALVLIVLAGVYAEAQGRALARLAGRAAVADRLDRLGDRLGSALSAEAAAADRLAGAVALAPPAHRSDLPPAEAGRAIAVRRGDGTTLSRPSDSEPAIAAALADAAPHLRGARMIDAPGGAQMLFWSPVDDTPGHVAAVTVSADAVLSSAGLLDADLGLDLALAAGATLGNPAVLAQQPVTAPLAMPGGAWTLAAVPHGGWGGGAAAHWPIRIATLLASALIVVPMLRTRWLVEERQRNIDALGSREAELERLSRRLDLALDASKVGVWDFNMETDVLVWDERQNELYDYTPGHPRSYADWRDRLHPDDLARAEAEFREAIEVTGRYVSDYRLVLPGGMRHIRAIGAVYREIDGSSRIVGVNWDVTADVQRNQELDAKRREAEIASSAKSQFLATMSHEIRTPMNGVIGMLDLILRSEPDPAQRERATIARDCANHLLAIVNDILDLSKLEANRITLAPAPTDVHALADDVVALMATGAADRDIEVSATVGPEVPRTLLCDATRVRQVLMNLVGNAVKFTETGAVAVTLAYRPEGGGRLEVAVRDTGVGIPEEAKRLLFERFAQVDSPLTRQRGGTGLGLAISRQLVELMGGEIAVESVAGLGSTFRFWIPAPPADDAADPQEPPAPLDCLPPIRVLVAEDNPTNRQLLAAYLAMAGHAAHMVGNGLEALAAVRDGGFDLVIMDVNMPVLDGLAATERIRALDGPAAAIPIIALTASAMDGDREDCLAAGMNEYVTKPVSLEALCAAMARCLAYGASASTGDQASPGSKLSIAPAVSSVASPRSAS